MMSAFSVPAMFFIGPIGLGLFQQQAVIPIICAFSRRLSWLESDEIQDLQSVLSVPEYLQTKPSRPSCT